MLRIRAIQKPAFGTSGENVVQLHLAVRLSRSLLLLLPHALLLLSLRMLARCGETRRRVSRASAAHS